jgi:hypothetical protein
MFVVVLHDLGSQYLELAADEFDRFLADAPDADSTSSQAVTLPED